MINALGHHHIKDLAIVLIVERTRPGRTHRHHPWAAPLRHQKGRLEAAVIAENIETIDTRSLAQNLGRPLQPAHDDGFPCQRLGNQRHRPQQLELTLPP